MCENGVGFELDDTKVSTIPAMLQLNDHILGANFGTLLCGQEIEFVTLPNISKSGIRHSGLEFLLDISI